MIEALRTVATRTLQPWARLPRDVRLLLAIVAVIATSTLAVVPINAPSSAPVIGNPAVGLAPMRDPSVPQASQALSADEQQQEAPIPTF